MIVSTETASPTPRRLRAAAWVGALFALPLGLVYCDHPTEPMATGQGGAEQVEIDARDGQMDDALLADLVDIARRYALDIRGLTSGQVSAEEAARLTRSAAEMDRRLLERLEAGELLDREEEAVQRLLESSRRLVGIMASHRLPGVQSHLQALVAESDLLVAQDDLLDFSEQEAGEALQVLFRRLERMREARRGAAPDAVDASTEEVRDRLRELQGRLARLVHLRNPHPSN